MPSLDLQSDQQQQRFRRGICDFSDQSAEGYCYADFDIATAENVVMCGSLGLGSDSYSKSQIGLKMGRRRSSRDKMISIISENLGEVLLGVRKADLSGAVVSSRPILIGLVPSAETKPPSADSVHVLLEQALHADDRALLIDCLFRQDQKLIESRVSTSSQALQLASSLDLLYAGTIDYGTDEDVCASSVTKHVRVQDSAAKTADFDDDEGGGLTLNAQSRAMLVQKLDWSGIASSITGSLGVSGLNGAAPSQAAISLMLKNMFDPAM
ncbi:PREDICTED: uncharacterized protein LOC109173503 [Ipomoea nil]|uniref:uncharacterized protein LOC109173503 n=1 Tax=Ipomoea nil TaxID=35883 RepID=UPI000900F485|nr:PREDICTED: uncharacterized protein LOC109173503 [Ipomoea nil]